MNLENNGIVCQTAAVIKADAIYKITFEDGVSVSEQERLASAVASEFHIEASQASTDQITGKGLFYGVKLAPRGLLLNRPDATKVDCGDLFD